MVEAFCALNIKVDLLEARTELLPWAPPELAAVVKQELESNAVQLVLGANILEIQQREQGLRIVMTDGHVDVDLVLVATGIEPRSELAAQAGLNLGPAGSIAVDQALRTSDPDIFAAGDCADAFHVVTGQRVWIPLALRANRAGWAVADNLKEVEVKLPGVVGTSVFRVLNLEVARTGLSFVEAEAAGFHPVEAHIKSRSRAHAHPGNQDIYVHLVADNNTGRLLGGNIIGHEGAAHRIDAVAVALHAGMTVGQFSQCDLGYAPPFSPVWDPMLTAANQLLKKIVS